MKPKKAFFGLVLLIFTGAITIVYLYSPLVYCMLVPWSDFKRVEPGLYVAPDIPENKIQELQTAIAVAKSRVATLYRGREADPVIIAGDKPSNGGHGVGKYGVTKSGTGISHILVVGSYIVLGPNGMNPDVIAHELTHCELARRVGFFKLRKIPSWFVEGLAMQLDYRPNYDESEWVKITNNGEVSISLEQIDTPPEFYNQAAFYHYIVAKHEVKDWLVASKTQGLLELIRKVKVGRDFQSSYDAKFR